METRRRTSVPEKAVEEIPSGYNTATEKANYLGAGKLGTASTYNVAEAYNEYYEKYEPEKYLFAGDPYDILKAANKKAVLTIAAIIGIFAADILINRLVFNKNPGMDAALLVPVAFVIYMIGVKTARVRANSVFKQQIVVSALKRRYPYMEYRGKEQIHMQNISASEIFPRGNLNFGNDYCRTDDFQFCKLRLCYYENPKYSDEYTVEVFNGVFAMVKLKSSLGGAVKLRSLHKGDMPVDGLCCISQSENFVCWASSQEDYSRVISAPLLDWLEFFSKKYHFNASFKEDVMYLAIYYKKDWFELGAVSGKEQIDASVNADIEAFDEIYSFLNKVSELLKG